MIFEDISFKISINRYYYSAVLENVSLSLVAIYILFSILLPPIFSITTVVILAQASIIIAILSIRERCEKKFDIMTFESTLIEISEKKMSEKLTM